MIFNLLRHNNPTSQNPCGSYWEAGWIETTKWWPDINDDSKYMLFEANVKMPIGIDVFPAFWLFSKCNEIDIFEYHNDAGITHFTNSVHRWRDPVTDSCPDAHPTCFRGWDYKDLDQAYHTFAAAWRMNKSDTSIDTVTFFLDGRELWTQTTYKMEKYIGLTLILNSSIWSTSQASEPTQDFMVDWVRISQINTNHLKDFKYEYYSSLNNTNATQTCSSRQYSIAVGEDNQVFFREGDWISTYTYNNQTWNYSSISNTNNPDERINGDLKVGAQNDLYYRSLSDNTLHLYEYNNGWHHKKVDVSKDISSFEGAIATHHPSAGKNLIACSSPVIESQHFAYDRMYVYDKNVNQALVPIFENSDFWGEWVWGDICFMGDYILYRDVFSELSSYSPDPTSSTGFKYSKIILNNNIHSTITVRNAPGSITTSDIDIAKQCFIVDPNGWVAVVYYDNSAWNFGYCPTTFTNTSEKVAPTSNIIFSQDSDPRIFYTNDLNQLRFYKFTNTGPTGWEAGVVVPCNSSQFITDVSNNLQPGARNQLFYRNTGSKVRNVFWRCCESLNICDAKSIAYREGNQSNLTLGNIESYILFYPNPVNDVIYIEPHGINIKRIEIYSSNSMHIDSREIMNNDLIPLSVSGYKDGLYFIRCIGDNGIETLKFVKL